MIVVLVLVVLAMVLIMALVASMFTDLPIRCISMIIVCYSSHTH